MKVDFEKGGGLVPAIIQDAVTKNVRQVVISLTLLISRWIATTTHCS